MGNNQSQKIMQELDSCVQSNDCPGMERIFADIGSSKNGSGGQQLPIMALKHINKNGDNLLHTAVKHHAQDALELLCKASNVRPLARGQNIDGFTPLMLAVCLEDTEAVVTLLDMDASFELLTITEKSHGNTAMHEALMTVDPMQTLERLLYAAITYRPPKQATPTRARSLRTSLGFRSNPSSPRNSGDATLTTTTTITTSRSGSLKSPELGSEQLPPQQSTQTHQQQHHHHHHHHQQQQLQQQQQQHVPMGSGNSTPTSSPSRDDGESEELTNLSNSIISSCRVIAASDNSKAAPGGLTPHQAELMRKLLETRNNKGQTVLLMACAVDAEAVVRILLERGCNVCAKDNAKMTCVHYAAMHDNLELAKDLLVAKGVRADDEDGFGCTPLYYALNNKSKDMENLLVSKGADLTRALDMNFKNAYHTLGRSTQGR
eukprot:Clim_evm30s214 gene=Clim_evmTU30s214